jgi:hypothetical protein
MTDREIMQQALEALEETSGGYSRNIISALRERLAQPEQEPVVWEVGVVNGVVTRRLAQPEHKPMHPTLQKMWEGYFDKCYKREWVGLTDEEELMIGVATGLTGVAIRMIEAKLREKNT